MAAIVKYNDQIIEIGLVGQIVGSELVSQLAEVLDIEAREPFSPNRIVDLREADTSELRFNDIFAIAERRRHEKLKNSIRSAFVVNTNVQYGIARTFQTINDNPQIKIRVFRDEAEARAWLTEDPGEARLP